MVVEMNRPTLDYICSLLNLSFDCHLHHLMLSPFHYVFVLLLFCPT